MSRVLHPEPKLLVEVHGVVPGSLLGESVIDASEPDYWFDLRLQHLLLRTLRLFLLLVYVGQSVLLQGCKLGELYQLRVFIKVFLVLDRRVSAIKLLEE